MNLSRKENHFTESVFRDRNAKKIICGSLAEVLGRLKTLRVEVEWKNGPSFVGASGVSPIAGAFWADGR